jgi:threonine/homoserine/homoserine lactone efflux protein
MEDFGVAFLLALMVGALTGYLGAVPPGPVNISVIRKVLRNQARAGMRIGAGGAAVDALLCAIIGLGIGWFGAFLSQPVVRLALALFLGAYGLKLLWFDRRRSVAVEVLAGAPAHPGIKTADVSLGALLGAANPALILNWSIMIGILVAHGVIQASVAGTLGFAFGVGIGCFAWFCSLIWIFRRFAGSPVVRWWDRSTVLAGGALVLIGAYFTFETVRQM